MPACVCILPAASMLACCLYACLLPICLPAASMLACCQYACLLPLCLPVANMSSCCLYACLLPICLPAASMLAYCQYACLLPLCLPNENMPACCLYACLMPICLPAASMLAYCQYACLLHLYLPTAKMLAYCQYACLLTLCLPICLPAHMSAASFISILRPYASCYGLQSAFTSACLPTFKSICLLACTFYQTTVHTSMSLSLRVQLSDCLTTVPFCLLERYSLSLYFFRPAFVFMPIYAFLWHLVRYRYCTVPICTSLSACK
jgi:hypothetical protein